MLAAAPIGAKIPRKMDDAVVDDSSNQAAPPRLGCSFCPFPCMEWIKGTKKRAKAPGVEVGQPATNL